MIGRLFSLVIDCPDTSALAGFYEELLGLSRVEDGPDYVVSENAAGTERLTFQRVGDFQPPRWRDPARPARAHLDVQVDDLDVAEPLVLALGATLLEGSDKPIGYRVYADPVGHPFCLVTPESVVLGG
ncbi:VOC family protein [Phytomonospora endophytica]|uniref:Catechol 2,3-dioxygenase-like lactoylglutathione lyase family enzyme n=1 Tax=Phytomonospora endophytica TaxID=714109 RepID=A0A841FK09_9ACTN|nr:VOC family protein [Phytomonospora endophytica]MBB6036214.1 catechol 2,3-dioxygenase-like lactoylglutathione lyase family enzyme [Phytomonospora endophytica]GIG67120.1 glyoxalase [Phytomonospora endophytica]